MRAESERRADVESARARIDDEGIVVGLVSVVSFLLIALLVDGTNALIARVVWVDVVALVALLGAGLLHAGAKRAGVS